MRSLIKPRLAEARMTALSLSRELGVHRNTVGSWCKDRGVAAMTLARASEVARALGCRVDDLFEDEGDGSRGSSAPGAQGARGGSEGGRP